MNIFVCVKQVPETDARLVISSDGKSVDASQVRYMLNPYDELSIEAALQIKEKKSAASITLISMGPERVEQVLRTGLAMGADAAIRMDAPEDLDPLQVAKVLEKVLSPRSPDIIFCGKQAIDDDSSQVGAALAALLKFPCVSLAQKITLLESSLSIEREIDGGMAVVETVWPLVITTQLGLNQPRYPSLPNILKAKKKLIEVISLTGLGIASESYVQVLSLSPAPTRKRGRILQGELSQQVAELIDLLRPVIPAKAGIPQT